MLTQQQAFDLFDYRNGKLYWKVNANPRAPIGTEAGSPSASGHLKIGYKRKYYFAHRIVFLMFNGAIPRFIDHINGDPSDNRIENLRAATAAQNAQNRKLNCNSISKIKNVHWSAKRNNWQVQMNINGRYTFIGTFKDIEMANLVASEYRDKYHGEFANHG
jgi:hypothetical protein